MRKALLMPKFGLTMTEGTVIEWVFAAGERFKSDQTVFVVETDKAANDIAAEAEGVLLEIVHAAGATVPVQGLEICATSHAAVSDSGVVTDGSGQTRKSVTINRNQRSR